VNVALPNIVEDIAAHRRILTEAFPDATFSLRPILLPATDDDGLELPHVWEVWWAIFDPTADFDCMWMTVQPDGLPVYMDPALSAETYL
jgi:hypothetical protein